MGTSDCSSRPCVPTRDGHNSPTAVAPGCLPSPCRRRRCAPRHRGHHQLVRIPLSTRQPMQGRTRRHRRDPPHADTFPYQSQRSRLWARVRRRRVRCPSHPRIASTCLCRRCLGPTQPRPPARCQTSARRLRRCRRRSRGYGSRTRCRCSWMKRLRGTTRREHSKYVWTSRYVCSAILECVSCCGGSRIVQDDHEHLEFAGQWPSETVAERRGYIVFSFPFEHRLPVTHSRSVQRTLAPLIGLTEPA